MAPICGPVKPASQGLRTCSLRLNKGTLHVVGLYSCYIQIPSLLSKPPSSLPLLCFPPQEAKARVGPGTSKRLQGPFSALLAHKAGPFLKAGSRCFHFITQVWSGLKVDR